MPVARVVRVGAALVALALVAAGCRESPPVRPGRFADYCTRRARCEGGNSRDINACQASFEGTLAQADAFGCRSVYDAMLQCLLRKARCGDGRLAADCSTELATANACLAAGARN